MRQNKAAQKRIQKAVRGRRIHNMLGVKEEKKTPAEGGERLLRVQIVRG